MRLDVGFRELKFHSNVLCRVTGEQCPSQAAIRVDRLPAAAATIVGEVGEKVIQQDIDFFVCELARNFRAASVLLHIVDDIQPVSAVVSGVGDARRIVARRAFSGDKLLSVSIGQLQWSRSGRFAAALTRRAARPGVRQAQRSLIG